MRPVQSSSQSVSQSVSDSINQSRYGRFFAFGRLVIFFTRYIFTFLHFAILFGRCTLLSYLLSYFSMTSVRCCVVVLLCCCVVVVLCCSVVVLLCCSVVVV